MHIIGTILSALFIALLIGVALSFGLALMGAILIVALAATLMVYGKQMWMRWRFKENASRAEGGVHIIEAEYTEITRKED